MANADVHPPGHDPPCSGCGKITGPEDRFCSACGMRLQIFCWNCGHALRVPANVCGRCGTILGPSAPAQSPPISPIPSESHAAPNSAESQEAEENFGERRVATVVMSDLSGYTAMSERLDPELVENLTATIKKRAHDIVSEFGGTINQFVGDEIFALYGVPTSQGRDACDAVSATLKLHAMVMEISLAQAAPLGCELTLHSGVSSGLVLINRRDARDGVYTTTGDTVNTAARLVTIAGPNEIVVSPKTRAAIADDFEMTELELVQLRGKNKPIAPYLVVGPVPEHDGRAGRRGFTTLFANRMTEMAKLAELSARAKEELTCIVITGDNGIGKSRLVHEFVATAQLSDFGVFVSYTSKVGQRIPYFAWTQALKAALGLTENISPEDAAGIVVSRCEGSALLHGYAGPLLHLLSLPSALDTDAPQDISGATSQRELWDAVLAFLRDLCTSRAGFLVFDDWQFADEVSVALLEEVRHELSSCALGIIVCSTETGILPDATQIELSDLELDATISMLTALLRVEHVAPELVQAIYERTDGNPLFIEETALAMLQDGTITIDAFARLAVPPEQLALPENVQAAMLQRIDRLSPGDREIIRYAAVVGREFNVQFVQRMLPEADVDDAIRRLCVSGILIPIGESSSRFRFTHGTMQEVAYETLLRRARKKLHAAVGQAIEYVYPDSLADHYEELAFHYQRSADDKRAIMYAELAGDKAADRYALGDARRQYRDAYERMQSTGLRDEAMEQHACRVAIKWAKASVFAPTRAQLSALEGALQCAERRSDGKAMMEIEYWIGRLEYVFGHFNSAITRFERVAKFAAENGNAELEARSVAVLGRMMLFVAQPKRGEDILTRAIALLRPIQDVQEIAYSTSNFACLKALMGEFAVAEEQYARALRLARGQNNTSIESLILQQIGWARALRGDWPGTREICERCAVLAERTGNEVLGAFAAIESAYSISFDGDPQEAHAKMLGSIERYVRTGAHLAASVMHGWGAEALARAFDFAGALLQVRAAMDRESDGDRFGRAAAQRAIMLERAAAGNADGVRETFAQIDAFTKEFSLNSDRARATLTYAECLRELHQPDAADAFVLAHQQFVTFEMPWFANATAAKS